jgi:precorrin-3B synthase
MGGLHSFAPPSVLPDISPSSGEIGSFTVGTLSRRLAKASMTANLPP